jgi:anti-anti-sigma regulatory factor
MRPPGKTLHDQSHRINVGIFSLFGKKDRQPQSVDADGRIASAEAESRKKPRPSVARARPVDPTAYVQQDAAREASVKIDAIESEMSDELVGSRRLQRKTISRSTRSAGVQKKNASTSYAGEDETFVPLGGVSTGYLLTGDAWRGDSEAADPGSSQLLDEAAILFANHQNEIVEQVLQDAIVGDRLGASTSTAWSMLLDLYQVTGQREAFENLAVSYANKFETSPPAWKEMAALDDSPAQQAQATTPVIIFSGKLDGSIVKQLERIQKLDERHTALRLEFLRVTAVDPIGCGLLLRALQRIKKSGLELVLVGAPRLAESIRSILQIGRRDETEAPWLLLLEILQLLNRENEFEEASIDYCVTFEVSPPPFIPPHTKVTTALDEMVQLDEPGGHLSMPTVVDGKVGDLVSAIADHAALHQPAIIDCSRLARVEFGAAGQLFGGLAPLCRNGRQIEFHDVNYLVAALFHVIGMESIVRVVTRKN